MLVLVYTCQNATFLEITCHGSVVRLQVVFREYPVPSGMRC